MKFALILLMFFSTLFAGFFTGKFIYGSNGDYQIFIHDFGGNDILKSCGGEDSDENVSLNRFIMYKNTDKFEGKKVGQIIIFSNLDEVWYNDKNITIKTKNKEINFPILKYLDINVLTKYNSDNCFVKSSFKQNLQNQKIDPYSNYLSLSYINYMDENFTSYQTFISNFNGIHPTFKIINKVVDKNNNLLDLHKIYDLNNTKLLKTLKYKILSEYKKINNIQNDLDAKNDFFDFNSIDFTNNFCIDKNGITFYYPECQILPCMSDGISVFFNFDELKDYKQ